MSKKITVRNEIVVKAPKKNHKECLEEMFKIIEKHKLSFGDLKPLFGSFHIDDFLDFRSVLLYDMKNRFLTVGYVSKVDKFGSSLISYNVHLSIRLIDGTYMPLIVQNCPEIKEHFWISHFECVVGAMPDGMLNVLKKYVGKNRRSLSKKNKRAPITVREWEEALERISQLEDIVNRLADKL